MPNYFEENTAGLNRGLNNLATAFARQPYYQTLAQNRAAQAGYANARAGEQTSLADLNRARTADLLRKGTLVDTLQRVSPTAQSAMLAGKFDDPSVQEFTGAVSALTGQNRGDVQKSMKQGLGTLLALQGNTPMAAAVENPASVQNNQVNADERANRPVNNQVVLPTGGTLVDRVTGKPLTEGGVTLRPGESRFAPKTLSATPASPFASNAGMGDGSGGGETPAAESPEVVLAPRPGTATPRTVATRNQLVAFLLKSAIAPGSTVGISNVPNILQHYDQMTGQPPAPVAAANHPLAAVTPSDDDDAATPQPSPVAAPAANSVALPRIPATHVAYLLAHPEAARDFDAKYGAGAAAKYLSAGNR